jgi:2-polyprenyl-3-methyl-5-hydroxy-6-metoxy-1,4-benzoquinol methylase
MERSTRATSLAGHPSPAATPATSELKRPCPICGNSQRWECQALYEIPEFEVLRCRKCGVTFINEVVNDNFGFGVDHEIAEDPALTLKAVNDFRQIKQKLVASGVAEGPGRSLLDVGCGMGTFLQQAQHDGWKVAGLELSPAIAAYARQKRGLAVDSCSIESTTSFPSDSFDVVTMFGVIEHLASPPRAADECARILRPLGILVLQTPAEDGLMRRAGRLLYWASGGGVRFQVKQLYQMNGGHSVCFNRRSIRELLTRSGFKVLSVEGSTYGLRLLMMRFRKMPFPKKVFYSLGTCFLFSLGRILGSNHMTVYAEKQPFERSTASAS